MDELYDKKVECPVCSIEFNTKKVKSSRLRVKKKDSDLLTYYKGENPIKYHIFICPLCGYAATEEKFEKVRAEDRILVRDKITTKWKEREFAEPRSIDEAIKCYKLALYCGEVLSYKKVYMGGLCLNLGWLYRMKKDIESEEKFLKFALKKFRESYSTESLIDTSMDEITVAYLIGELSRRLGDKSEAVSWFSKVVTDPIIDTKPRIKKLAREQWNSIREK